MGGIDHWYCNIGLPPVITGCTLAFVDLDLDLQCWPDGRCEVLDEDEFAAHSLHYGYTVVEQTRARQALLDLVALWQAQASPFDRGWWVSRWRG